MGYLQAVIYKHTYSLKQFYCWLVFLGLTVNQVYFLTGFHAFFHSLLMIFWILTEKIDKDGKLRVKIYKGFERIYKKLKLDKCVEKVLKFSDWILPDKKRVLTKVQKEILQHKQRKQLQFLQLTLYFTTAIRFIFFMIYPVYCHYGIGLSNMKCQMNNMECLLSFYFELSEWLLQ